MPEISVIVPVYNASGCVRDCLDCLLGQTFGDIEIVAVNDGSTDDSLSIVEEYSVADSRVRVINQSNLGSGAARNAGVRAAQSPFVTFVDADDLAKPRMLEELYRAIVENDADMSICELQRVVFRDDCSKVMLDKLGFPNLSMQSGRTYTLVAGEEALQFQLDMISTAMGAACGKLVRRRLFDEFKVFFPEQHRFSEDAVTCARLYLHARRVAFVHKGLYEYVQTGMSTTSSYSVRKARDLITDMREVKTAIEQAGIAVCADNFYLANMFSAGKQVQWSNAAGKEKRIMRKRIQRECRQFHPDFRRKQMPLIYRLEAQISSRGLTSLACSLIRFFGWLPFVKRML